MRRGLALAAALLVLTGCGGNDAPAASDESSASSPSASAGASGSPSESGSPPASGSASSSPSAVPSNPEPAGQADQTSVLASLPGSADGGCVDTRDRDAYRSGGLAIAQLNDARRTWTAQNRSVRLVFVPQHADQAVRLTTTGSGPGRFTARADRASDTEDHRYFLVTAEIPKAGTWTIRATSGPDTGCWKVRID